MPNEQDSTAIVAIIIALIAFFVTTAQLLQALFGTAVGYRQCQPSVMGGWAKRTRRKWRWSEFRFETIFTTPNFQLSFYMENPNVVFVTGSRSSREQTYCTPNIPWVETGGSDDVAGWLSFLNMIHESQRRILAASPSAEKQRFPETSSGLALMMTCPSVTFRTRSWDFVPPDIVRPFATSNIGDIIVLAHRLGMRWKEVRPDDGALRAEGNGQSITSTTVRGFGTLLQYTLDQASYQEEARRSASNQIVPSYQADMLGFQIVPGDRTLFLPDFVFDDSNGFVPIDQIMESLGVNRNVRDMYAKSFQRSGRLHGFSDLIGMVAPFLPLPGSSIVQIFAPYPQFHDSPTNWWQGFVVYHARLLEYIEEQKKAGSHSKQISWVLDRFKYMRRTYPWNQCPSWEREIENKRVKNGRSLSFLNDLRDTWSATTTYFLSLGPSFRYIDLVGAHIAQAVYYPDLAEANIKAGQNKWYELGAAPSKRVAEGMHIYIDQIPKVVDFMKEKGFDDATVVTEAWWTLILRAMCWHRSIAFVEIPKGNLVPPSFHGSMVPVYIA